MKEVFLFFIRFYRKAISPFLPHVCRFYPTCSAYAMESISRFGAVRGGFLTIKRLLKCHPFHPGGLDPVPAHFTACGCGHSHLEEGK